MLDQLTLPRRLHQLVALLELFGHVLDQLTRLSECIRQLTTLQELAFQVLATVGAAAAAMSSWRTTGTPTPRRNCRSPNTVRPLRCVTLFSYNCCLSTASFLISASSRMTRPTPPMS